MDTVYSTVGEKSSSDYSRNQNNNNHPTNTGSNPNTPFTWYFYGDILTMQICRDVARNEFLILFVVEFIWRTCFSDVYIQHEKVITNVSLKWAMCGLTYIKCVWCSWNLQGKCALNEVPWWVFEIICLVLVYLYIYAFLHCQNVTHRGNTVDKDCHCYPLLVCMFQKPII